MATKFTSEQTDTIVGTYQASVDAGDSYEDRSAVVADLAVQFDATINQIRGKLVSENVYVAKDTGKDTGAVAKVGTKEDYRKAFEAATGKDLRSMENMTRKDLETLWGWMINTFDRAVADAKAGKASE